MSPLAKLWPARLVVAVLALATLALLTSLMSPVDLAAQPPPGREVTIVSPLPLPVTGTVGISGTVPVRSVAEPGLAPYEETQTYDLQSFDFNTTLTLGFPAPAAGKRLVIRHASGGFLVPHPAAVAFVGLWKSASDSIRPRFYLPGSISEQAVGNNIARFYSLNQDVLAYFDAGDSPEVDIFFVMDATRGATVPTRVTVTLTGYLVNIP